MTRYKAKHCANVTLTNLEDIGIGRDNKCEFYVEYYVERLRGYAVDDPFQPDEEPSVEVCCKNVCIIANGQTTHNLLEWFSANIINEIEDKLIDLELDNWRQDNEN